VNSHEPPVKLFGIPGRYATATYIAASKQNKLDVVEQELRVFVDGIKKYPTLKNLVENPTISRDKKTEALVSILGKRFNPITSNMLLTVAANNRLGELKKIADDFFQLMKAKRGEVDVTITSADPMTSEQLETLKTCIRQYLKPNSKINVQTAVDPAVLGGFKIDLGDKFLDMTVLSKIKQYERLLKN